MNRPDNTLYLNIKQEFFDQIMAGTKTQEFRKVKPTTVKKLIQLDENGIEMEDENHNSMPIQYSAIHFRVGMNKVADEAIVEVKNAHTEVFVDENGDLIEYITDEKGNRLFTDGKKMYTEKQLAELDRSFQTDEEAEKFFKNIRPAVPEFNEDGNCTNGVYWIVEQVVYDLGKVLEKNIVSK